MVPANYVTAERGYSAALDAFNRVSRDCAEVMLQSSPYRESFNYIIRPSTGNYNSVFYSITINICVCLLIKY